MERSFFGLRGGFDGRKLFAFINATQPVVQFFHVVLVVHIFDFLKLVGVVSIIGLCFLGHLDFEIDIIEVNGFLATRHLTLFDQFLLWINSAITIALRSRLFYILHFGSLSSISLNFPSFDQPLLLELDSFVVELAVLPLSVYLSLNLINLSTNVEKTLLIGI